MSMVDDPFNCKMLQLSFTRQENERIRAEKKLSSLLAPLSPLATEKDAVAKFNQWYTAIVVDADADPWLKFILTESNYSSILDAVDQLLGSCPTLVSDEMLNQYEEMRTDLHLTHSANRLFYMHYRTIKNFHLLKEIEWTHKQHAL